MTDPTDDLPASSAAKRYDAFVSYSHSADGELAPAIQTGLQRFARAWNRRRALEVFRDQTGLAVNPDLWRSICTAMDGSEWFVLLCSPGAAASEWVGKEIERWVATHGPDRLLPVVTEGTFVWDDAAGDIDLSRSTAAHPALAGVFRAEPRHIDMSWARTDTDLTLRNPRFRDQVAEIAAPMHGTTKDELEGEDVRRQRQVRRLVRGAVAVLVVLTLAATGSAAVAVRNGREAARQRDEAEAQRAEAERQREEAERQARQATSQRLATLSLGASGALQPLLAVQAHRMAETPQATGAMIAAATGGSEGISTRLTGHDQGVTDVAHGPDGTVIATVDGEGAVRAFDAAGEQIGEAAGLGAVAVAVAGSDLVAAATADGVALLAPGAAEPDRVVDLGSPVTAVATTGSGTVLAATADGSVATVDADGAVGDRSDGVHAAPVRAILASVDGDVVVSYGSEDAGDGAGPPAGGSVVVHGDDLAATDRWDSEGEVLALSADGSTLVVAPEGPDPSADGFVLVRLVEPVTGQEQVALRGPDYYVARDAALTPDGATVVIVTTGGSDGAPGQAFAAPTDGGSGRTQLLPVQMASATATSVAPDGQTAVVAGSDDEAPALVIAGDDLGGEVPLDGAVASVPFSSSPATGFVAVDLLGGGVGVADGATGEVTPLAPDAAPGAVITPDGTRLLTSVGLVSVPDGATVGDAPGPAPDVPAAFSADGARAAYVAADTDEVVVVDVVDGGVVARGAVVVCVDAPECAQAGLALSADGRTLYLHPVPAGGSGPATLQAVDVSDGWAPGAEVVTAAPGAVAVVEERLLVQSGVVVVEHDGESLEPAGAGRTGEVSGQWARQADGLAVVSDCDVDLVDPVSLRAVADIPVESQPTEGGCLVDDLGAGWSDEAGTVLLTAYRTGSCDEPGECPLQRWDLAPDRLADRLCATAGRDLTADEWEQFLPGWDPEPTCPDDVTPAAPEADDEPAPEPEPGSDPAEEGSTTTTDDEGPSTSTSTSAPSTSTTTASDGGTGTPEDALVAHLQSERPGLLTAASGDCDAPGAPGGVVCHVVLSETADQVVMGVGYPQSDLLAVYLLTPDGDGWLVAEEHGVDSGDPVPEWAAGVLGG